MQKENIKIKRGLYGKWITWRGEKTRHTRAEEAEKVATK